MQILHFWAHLKVFLKKDNLVKVENEKVKEENKLVKDENEVLRADIIELARRLEERETKEKTPKSEGKQMEDMTSWGRPCWRAVLEVLELEVLLVGVVLLLLPAGDIFLSHLLLLRRVGGRAGRPGGGGRS